MPPFLVKLQICAFSLSISLSLYLSLSLSLPPSLQIMHEWYVTQSNDPYISLSHMHTLYLPIYSLPHTISSSMELFSEMESLACQITYPFINKLGCLLNVEVIWESSDSFLLRSSMLYIIHVKFTSHIRTIPRQRLEQWQDDESEKISLASFLISQ